MWQGTWEISVKTVFYYRFYELFPYSSFTPVTINLLCVCDILCHICEVQNVYYISQCPFYSHGKGNNALDRPKYYYLLSLKMSIKTRGKNSFCVKSARVHCKMISTWRAYRQKVPYLSPHKTPEVIWHTL